MENVTQNGIIFVENKQEKNKDIDKTKMIAEENGFRNTSIDSSNSSKNESKLQDAIHRTLGISVFGLMRALNIAYVPLFIYRLFEKREKYIPISDPILKIPASELTQKIRKKEISCVEVIEKYIARIKEVNPIINAVIEDRFVQALEEAKKLDQWINSDDFVKNQDNIANDYPLLGVPISVKGSIGVKGLKHTSGMVTRNKITAEDDAVSVKQAKKAGAIPLLVSNVPELCMNWETSNKLVGTTKNPYDTTRTCGGSSGGEGSLLGSGASLIGIGSDIAGSLRLPAHFCGVYGHKPTPSTVSDSGHFPNSTDREQWEGAFTIGPMSRYAKDLRTLLKVIVKPEKQEQLKLDEKVDIKNVKVHYINDYPDNSCDKTSQECSNAVLKVVDYFSKTSNAEPEKVDFHQLQFAGELAAIHLLQIDDINDIFDNNDSCTTTEYLRYLTFRSKHTFMPISYSVLKKIVTSLPKNYKEKIAEDLTSLRNKFQETLGDNGILVMPTYHVEAFKHGDALKYALNNGYMSIFNALGFPVTNCPVTLTKEGLPVGIQVVGMPYSDKLTLAIAEEIERAFGGWREPQK